MRLQLEGTFTLEEFQDAISVIIEDFKSHKIDSFRSINIYALPCHKGRVIRMVDKGQEVEHMVFGVNPPTQVAISSDNFKVVPSYRVQRNLVDDESDD